MDPREGGGKINGPHQADAVELLTSRRVLHWPCMAFEHCSHGIRRHCFQCTAAGNVSSLIDTASRLRQMTC